MREKVAEIIKILNSMTPQEFQESGAMIYFRVNYPDPTSPENMCLDNLSPQIMAMLSIVLQQDALARLNQQKKQQGPILSPFFQPPTKN